MTDDEQPLEDGGSQRALHYDFLKWLTTLSLVSIGGVFSLLSQAEFKLPGRELLVILGALGLAAISGLSGAGLQVDKANGKPWSIKRSRGHIQTALLALGIGAGYFTLAFVGKLMR